MRLMDATVATKMNLIAYLGLVSEQRQSDPRCSQVGCQRKGCQDRRLWLRRLVGVGSLIGGGEGTQN
jgi:hypothetical protein